MFLLIFVPLILMTYVRQDPWKECLHLLVVVVVWPIKKLFLLDRSVTRWLDYFSIFGYYINENLPNAIENLPKLVQKNAKYYKNCQKN